MLISKLDNKWVAKLESNVLNRTFRYISKMMRLREVKRCSFETIESVPVDESTIVSLTSYGKRLETVDIAIKSVLMQSVRPKAIVLYLAEGEDTSRISRELLSFRQYGLEIVTGVADYKSHKKYFYAFKDFPDSNIITIDDDLLYPSDFIESLTEAQKRVDGCVLARRTHRIRLDSQGKLEKYGEWEGEWKSHDYVPRRSLLATTGAGSLYSPDVIGKLSSDPKDFMEYSPNADDLWLKFLEINANVKVVHVPNNCNTPYAVPNTQVGTLAEYNVDQGGNDKAISVLMSYFDFEPSVFLDD